MKLKLPIVASLLALVSLLNCGQPAASSQPAISQPQLVRLPPEVRLRKLHLVRPDLIQYPVCFEVYC